MGAAAAGTPSLQSRMKPTGVQSADTDEVRPFKYCLLSARSNQDTSKIFFTADVVAVIQSSTSGSLTSTDGPAAAAGAAAALAAGAGSTAAPPAATAGAGAARAALTTGAGRAGAPCASVNVTTKMSFCGRKKVPRRVDNLSARWENSAALSIGNVTYATKCNTTAVSGVKMTSLTSLVLSFYSVQHFEWVSVSTTSCTHTMSSVTGSCSAKVSEGSTRSHEENK